MLCEANHSDMQTRVPTVLEAGAKPISSPNLYSSRLHTAPTSIHSNSLVSLPPPSIFSATPIAPSLLDEAKLTNWVEDLHLECDYTLNGPTIYKQEEDQDQDHSCSISTAIHGGTDELVKLFALEHERTNAAHSSQLREVAEKLRGLLTEKEAWDAARRQWAIHVQVLEDYDTKLKEQWGAERQLFTVESTRWNASLKKGTEVFQESEAAVVRLKREKRELIMKLKVVKVEKEAQKAKWGRERDMLCEQRREMEHAIQLVERERFKLEGDNSTLQGKVVELQQATDADGRKMQDESEAIANLKAELELARKGKETEKARWENGMEIMCYQRKALELRIYSLEQERWKLTEEKLVLRGKVVEIEQARDDQARKVEERSQSIAKLEAEVEAFKSGSGAALEDLPTLRSQVAKLSSTNDKLRRRNKELEKTLCSPEERSKNRRSKRLRRATTTKRKVAGKQAMTSVQPEKVALQHLPQTTQMGLDQAAFVSELLNALNEKALLLTMANEMLKLERDRANQLLCHSQPRMNERDAELFPHLEESQEVVRRNLEQMRKERDGQAALVARLLEALAEETKLLANANTLTKQEHRRFDEAENNYELQMKAMTDNFLRQQEEERATFNDELDRANDQQLVAERQLDEAMEVLEAIREELKTEKLASATLEKKLQDSVAILERLFAQAKIERQRADDMTRILNGDLKVGSRTAGVGSKE